MIAELDHTSATGTDLAGSGGVGGLVVEWCYRVSGGTTSREGYAPCYDGNGNVMALVSLSLGEAVGRYEYGAFGETISVEGDWVVQGNPVRFSTKYGDAETGLVYDTHRYYEAATGRWLSRDPIEEDSVINLYGMVGNDPLDNVDVLGQSIVGKAYKAFKKKLRQKGLSLLVQVHHKIGQQVFEHAKYGPWLKNLGFVADESKSLIMLPNKLGKCLLSATGSQAARRTLHEGRHSIKDYVGPVMQRLDEVLDLHKAGKITDCDARGLVAELQKELTEGLRKGTIKLNEAEALDLGEGALNFMGMAVIHLSSTDQFIEDVEVHVSVGTYTGKTPMGCWVGEVADFFNPLTDYVEIVSDAKSGWDIWNWLSGIGRDLPGGYWPSGGNGW